jgi:hypothetical protein
MYQKNIPKDTKNYVCSVADAMKSLQMEKIYASLQRNINKKETKQSGLKSFMRTKIIQV